MLRDGISDDAGVKILTIKLLLFKWGGVLGCKWVLHIYRYTATYRYINEVAIGRT